MSVPFEHKSDRTMICKIGTLFFALVFPCWALAADNAGGGSPMPSGADSGFEYIDTGFENASPIWYDFAADGAIQVHLLYDHERSSPNRAAGHFHFQIHAKPGAKLTVEFKNLDNVWNGKIGSVAGETKVAVVSENGRDWKPIPLESLPENRVRLHVEMPGPRLYVARLEPYRISDLDRLLKSIEKNPRVEIAPIGKTVEGRPLEIVRVGDPQSPHHVFLRARAHPWESGGNWVVEGLIRRLLKNDDEAKKYLRSYCLWVLPMANKDGVAQGWTRFNVQGKDLNRNWDKPADASLAPENAAVEKWVEAMIAQGRRPELGDRPPQRRQRVVAREPTGGQVAADRSVPCSHGTARKAAAGKHLVHRGEHEGATSVIREPSAKGSWHATVSRRVSTS